MTTVQFYRGISFTVDKDLYENKRLSHIGTLMVSKVTATLSSY
jgi:DNA-directed RNA polymerase beta subunit